MPFDARVVGKNAKQTYASLSNYTQYIKMCNLMASSNLSSNNLAAVLTVNPNAVEVGTLEYWNKRGQSIKPTMKGIPILKPYRDTIEVGYVFDLSQTQPSARSKKEGRTIYEHAYPFGDTKTAAFFDVMQNGVTDVRVIPSNAVTGKSQLQGAAIYINSAIPQPEQVRETLMQYYRYQFNKTYSGREQTAASPIEVEMSAATAAFVSGKKLGFSMPEPAALVKPPGSFSLDRFTNMENTLNNIHAQVKKFCSDIRREGVRQIEAQKEKPLERKM